MLLSNRNEILKSVLITVTAMSISLVHAESESKKDSTKYLKVVKTSCDTILENARDTYGQQKTGMILSVLDRKTGKPLTSLPTPPEGVRYGDRTGVGGSNANLQQDLYRTMEELSRITGDKKYDKAVDLAIADFLRVTQAPKTGLLAWGEHLYWNCLEDRLGDLDPNRTHEQKRKFIYFDLAYELEPTRTLNYARGLWEHQIADHKTGDFSRHARYDHHDPGKGWDFPKEGSYFIHTWSKAYEKTHDPYYLNAIKIMANRFLGRMNDRNLLDFDTTGKPERVNKCVPLTMLSLAIEAHDAAQRVDPDTAKLLRELAKRLDKGFLALPHMAKLPDDAFVFYAFTDSGKPRPDARKKTEGFSRHYGIGYGVQTSSMFAILSYTRQAQLGKTPAGDKYRKLVVQAADLYREIPFDTTKTDIWAGEYGLAIFTELAAFNLTGDRKYLSAARQYGDSAVADLWDNGDSALPRASSRCDYYDVISYSDTTMLALLALYEHLSGCDTKVPISDITR